MNAATLPHAASTTAGFPVYYMRTPADDATLLCYEPTLPSASHRWATADEIAGPCMALDSNLVAELLFAAVVDPDALDDTEAVDTVHQMLIAFHCDRAECDLVASIAYGDDPSAAVSRMNCCVIRAARLCGVRP